MREWLDEIGAGREEPVTPGISSPNVNISVGDRTITATMEDNAAARDFLSRLPLEVTLKDYNQTTEKIFYPSPALTTAGTRAAASPYPATSRSTRRGVTWRFLQERIAEQRPD